ncbi:MAG: hypothetical protein ACRC0A_00905 [Chitinophagaceae bacterium]
MNKKELLEKTTEFLLGYTKEFKRLQGIKSYMKMSITAVVIELLGEHCIFLSNCDEHFSKKDYQDWLRTQINIHNDLIETCINEKRYKDLLWNTEKIEFIKSLEEYFYKL